MKKIKIGDNIIKHIRDLLRLKKEIADTTIKDIRNLFRLRKENEAIKDRVIRDTRNLFEHEEEDYTPVRVVNFWSNNYLDNKSNSNRKPYHLKNILIKIDHT